MSTEDEIGQDFDQFVRTALMAVGQTTQVAAQRQQTRTLVAQQQRQAAEQAARDAERAAAAAERERTAVIHARVLRTDYWREASPASIENVAAYAATVADRSPKGEDMFLVVQSQIKNRYGVQIDADALRRQEPERQRARFAGALEAGDKARQQAPEKDPSFRYGYFDSQGDARTQGNYSKAEALAEIARAPQGLTRESVEKGEQEWLGPYIHRWFGQDADVDRAIAERLPQLIPDRFLDTDASAGPLARSIRAVGSTHTDVTASLGKPVTERTISRESAQLAAVQAAVGRPDYWMNATADRIANVATYTSQAAPFDPTGQAAHSTVAGQIQARYGVDVAALFTAHSDPKAQRDALVNALDDAMAARREDGLADQAAMEADRLLDRAEDKEADGDPTAGADEVAAADALSEAQEHRSAADRLFRDGDVAGGEQQPDGPDIQAQALPAAAAAARRESAPGFPEDGTTTLNKAVQNKRTARPRRATRGPQRDRSRGRGHGR